MKPFHKREGERRRETDRDGEGRRRRGREEEGGRGREREGERRREKKKDGEGRRETVRDGDGDGEGRVLDKDTKYSTLMSSFPKLYEELVSTSPSDMLTLNQFFHFANPDHFKDALPNADLTKCLMDVTQEYSPEVCQLLSLLLKKFAYGFEYQNLWIW